MNLETSTAGAIANVNLPETPCNNDTNDRKRRLSESSDSEEVKKRTTLGGSDTEEGNKKRIKLEAGDEHHGMNQAPALRQPDLPIFNLTSARRPNQNSDSRHSEEDTDDSNPNEWQTVEKGGRTKKNAKKIPKKNSHNYPKLEFSRNSRLQAQVKISDVQSLVLYILADGNAPQFISVSHRPSIRKVVVLMVPGLESSMFGMKTADSDNGYRRHGHQSYTSPDEYYPKKLDSRDLPESLRPLADMFELVWPVKAPGDDRMGKMHSPLHAMLTAPLPKEKEDKKNNSNQRKGARPAKAPPGWKDTRTRITEFVQTAEELLENEYVVHPAAYSEEQDKKAWAEYRESKGVSRSHGWVDTEVANWEEGTAPEDKIESGSLTAGREILAMDCEMCMTDDEKKEFALTRISIVGWDGTVVLDELVKPEKPITNYLTQYSGITKEMLANVTTTLEDIQNRLLRLLHPRTILIGHSLNSDLNALKLTHPFIIDTAILYPHPRGPPLKSSLKWLAQKFLKREIQKGHGTTGPGAGHDSIEDAKTCLDLVKQKCEKGQQWGTGDSQGENIFKRVSRAGVRYKNQGGAAVPSDIAGKSSAAIDWGDPKKGPGAAASFQIGCQSDDDVVNGVIRAVKGDHDGKEIPGGGVDFVWGRFRELEAVKGWWNDNKMVVAPPAQTAPTGITTVKAGEHSSKTEGDEASTSTFSPPKPNKSVSEATADVVSKVQQIYDSLPPCTTFIVYSGSGDPREMSRLSNMQMQFKREYRLKKWDELSVKWTDTEEQAMKKAAKEAREGGVGFLVIK